MIPAVDRTALRLRAGALLGLGALSVHELRYLVGYGQGAGRALSAHGHSYLTLATTLVVLGCILALGVFLAAIARGDGAGSRRGSTLVRVSVCAAVALIAIYSFQELLEGLVAGGHPSGVAGVWGAGGWSAVPIASAIGVVIALLLRGAEAVLAHFGRRRTRHLRRGGVPTPARRPRPATARQTGLARHLAGRAPPLSRA